MASTQTGLEALRQTTTVDCDTMDEEVAKNFGVFQDCTSNQAIAYNELSNPKYADLLRASRISAAYFTHSGRFPSIPPVQLAVDIAMVKLALKIAPHILGRVHIQTNPYYSYSTEKTVANALRIVQIFQYLQPGFETSRICIKIPSTWEGMLACRTLELGGVRTLATTLFTRSQAALAAEVGCSYVAPYVNQLRVHFEPGFTDPNKLLSLCVYIQRFYKEIGNTKTKVLPASLTSVEEVFALKGVDHITIAPGLLGQLSKPGSVPSTNSLFDADAASLCPMTSYLNDPSAYKIAFTRDLNGASEGKLTQAINIFCDMQDKLEQLLQSKLDADNSLTDA